MSDIEVDLAALDAAFRSLQGLLGRLQGVRGPLDGRVSALAAQPDLARVQASAGYLGSASARFFGWAADELVALAVLSVAAGDAYRQTEASLSPVLPPPKAGTGAG